MKKITLILLLFVSTNYNFAQIGALKGAAGKLKTNKEKNTEEKQVEKVNGGELKSGDASKNEANNPAFQKSIYQLYNCSYKSRDYNRTRKELLEFANSLHDSAIYYFNVSKSNPSKFASAKMYVAEIETYAKTYEEGFFAREIKDIQNEITIFNIEKTNPIKVKNAIDFLENHLNLVKSLFFIEEDFNKLQTKINEQKNTYSDKLIANKIISCANQYEALTKFIFTNNTIPSCAKNQENLTVKASDEGVIMCFFEANNNKKSLGNTYLYLKNQKISLSENATIRNEKDFFWSSKTILPTPKNVDGGSYYILKELSKFGLKDGDTITLSDNYNERKGDFLNLVQMVFQILSKYFLQLQNIHLHL